MLDVFGQPEPAKAKCPYCRYVLGHFLDKHQIWQVEQHYCSSYPCTDSSVRFQRQLIAELHYGYETNNIPIMQDGVTREPLTRWDVFNRHAMMLSVLTERGL